MPDSRKFSCFLMGHQSRLIQCGDILLEKGHSIWGVISDVPTIQNWAAEKSLRLLLPGNNLVSVLKQQPFDLFISIDNFLKVPDEVLTLPRMFAVNFHDAPLPKYAGTNATNWALINRESSHGVTWHIMTNVIDAGDILKQQKISISEGETALTLNAKCYETSVQIFAEFLDELAEGRVKPMRQELGERTFFSKWKRPPAACSIDWTRSAEEIDALNRGLDYGSYPNPLGHLKLYLNDDAVLVGKLALTQSDSSAEPGTLTKVNDNTIQVATATRDIALREFRLFNGKLLTPSELINQFGLAENKRLPTFDSQRADRITQIHSHLSKYEDFWVNRLSAMEPFEIPYAKRHTLRKNSANFEEILLSTAESGLTGSKFSEYPGDFILIAFILYLYRIGAKEGFDLNFRDVALKQQLSGSEPFFASFVPLHIDVEPGQIFADFFQSVLKQIDTIKKHGSYARDLILRMPRLREAFSNIDLQLPVAVERVESLTDFKVRGKAELLVVIPDDGKACIWRYDQKVIDQTSIHRMREQFTELLDDLARDQSQFITDLSILPEMERRKILVEWNDTHVDYPQNVCLHQLFESQAERTPDAVAVVYEDAQLTYREFNSRANQLAHHLKALGVGPETLVGLYMERSLEMVIGIYGIIKAGGAYVPLDPEYPPDRVAYMIEDTQVPVLLTQERLVSSLPQHSAKVIRLDADWNSIAGEKTVNLITDITAENLAYVIYTSGSTGKPKGVMNEHLGICNRIFWMQDEYGLTEADRILQKTPFSFDVSVWEFFWPLLFGARLIVARPGGHRDSDYLIKLIIEKEITTLHFVPSMLQMFLEEEGVENCRCLKRVICSGEALPYDLQRRFFERLNDVELHNLYGPTEAAVDVTYWPCQKESELHLVPIGYPVANTQMYILDSQLQPVPIGVIGELHIGGVQVARGYRNRPELTSEKFIPDPFSSQSGARLYKTGDLSRYLSDGAIEYIGRTDFQVKIRGLRIELGEIEALLADYDGVSHGVVMLREDQPGDKRLVAYIVCKPGNNGQIAELRNYLRKKLPDYMVPQHFVKLDAIPLSPNGKADRRALPKPEVDRISDQTYIPPRNSTQKTIAEIWQDLLQLKKVGINDSFFDLGGHSLLLVKMLRRLKASFSANLNIVDLFQYPTIAKLTQFLSQQEDLGISFRKTQDLANKQIASLKRHKRFASTRRKLNGK